MSAKTFFESVSEASRDAQLCKRTLDALESSALRLPSPSLEARVLGGHHDAMASRVGALVDRETALHARIEQDYQLIDKACEVLYGVGQDGSAGLSSIAPRWWADLIYYRYVQCLSWVDVAALLGYSKRYVMLTQRTAFDVLDANGMAQTIAGMGMAES